MDADAFDAVMGAALSGGVEGFDEPLGGAGDPHQEEEEQDPEDDMFAVPGSPQGEEGEQGSDDVMFNPQNAMPNVDDLDPVGVRPPKFEVRGPVKCAWMRECKARKRSIICAADANNKVKKAKGQVDTLAMLAPGAARAAGMKPVQLTKKGKISEERAIEIIRAAFCHHSLLLAQSRSCFLICIEATVVRLCMERMAHAGHVTLCCVQAFKRRGYRTIVHFDFEWDDAQMGVKSLGLLSALRDSERGRQVCKYVEERLEAKRLNGHFQQKASHSVMVMSGRVKIVAMAIDGRSLSRTFFWSYPPLTMPNKTNLSLQAALKRMPMHLSHGTRVADLAQVADVVSAHAMRDNSSANLAACGQMRQRAAAAGPNVLFDQDDCKLHNNNNSKAGSKDCCALTGKLFALSSVMNAPSYQPAAIGRICDFVEKQLRRYEGLRPNVLTLEMNRRLLNQLYKLGSEHHVRKCSKSSEAQLSTLLVDIEELLTLETGPLQSETIEHFCWDPLTGKPCCESLEECKAKFIRAYANFYIGRIWPTPSVSRFTYTTSVKIRTLMGYVHHGIIVVLVEPFEWDGVTIPSLLEMGAQISDHQAVHRVRKHEVYRFFIERRLTKVEVAASLVFDLPIDDMTYDFFGRKGSQLTEHEVLGADGVLARCLVRLRRLLETWAEPEAEEWLIVDSACGFAYRQNAPLEVRKYVRRNIIIYGAGTFRRQEMHQGALPNSLHALRCDVCTPGVEAKHRKWVEFANRRACCKGFFCWRFFSLFAAPQVVGAFDPLALKYLEVREDAKKYTSKESEAGHAWGKRILGTKRKQNCIQTYARTAFLQRIRAGHSAAGGDPKWAGASNVKLVGRLRSEYEERPEQKALHHAGTPALHDEAVDVLALSTVDAGGAVAPAMAGAAPQAEALPGGPAPAKRGGLNGLLLAQNARLQAAKALKGTKLTKGEVDQCRDYVTTDWEDERKRAEMREKHQHWGEERKILVAEPQREVAALSRTFFGWGTHSLPVPPEAIVQDIQRRGIFKNEEIYNERAGSPHSGSQQFIVNAPDGDEAEMLEVTTESAPCAAQSRNACRESLRERGLLHMFDVIVDGVSHVVDDIGSRGNSAEVLFMCEIVGGFPFVTGYRRHVFALLAKPIGRPKVQTFLRCARVNVASQGPVSLSVPDGAPLETPFILKFMTRGALFNPEVLVLDFCTSDEIAETICNLAPTSDVFINELTYDIPANVMLSYVKVIGAGRVLWRSTYNFH